MDKVGPRDQFAKVGGDKDKDKVVKNNEPGMKVAGNKEKAEEELDPRTIWQQALAGGLEEPGLIIAAADFLAERGLFLDVAELLKANLRQGILVRPWVYEALALALEASGGSPEEIRRVRLSGVALDPQDADGFLKAARALSEHKQYDRALALCRQAAELRPNDPRAYANALAYAELGKDSRGMEWAAGGLLSQEWPTDNHALQLKAQARLDALAGALEADQKKGEAARLRATLQKLRQRDLVIHLSWEAGSSGPAGLELYVKEAAGTVCSQDHRMSPGGGTLTGGTLSDPRKVSYVAAQAFSGEYEIKVRLLWGQPLGNKARLEIVRHQGTVKESRKIETISVDGPVVTLKVKLDDGRRTSLAVITPVEYKRTEAKTDGEKGVSTREQLRDLADPYYTGRSGGLRGAVNRPSVLTREEAFGGTNNSKKLDNVLYQTGIAPQGGTGLSLNAQVVNTSQGPGLTINPVFQRGAFIPRNGSTLPGIPGAGN
jgi:tetratricopeptide (TPR) repeat protein